MNEISFQIHYMYLLSEHKTTCETYMQLTKHMSSMKDKEIDALCKMLSKKSNSLYKQLQQIIKLYPEYYKTLSEEHNSRINKFTI